jgi:hypothetical protein
MQYPFQVDVNNQSQAWKMKNDVQIGHYFVFLKHKTSGTGRLKRLLIEAPDKRKVLPLVDEPVTLKGVTITSKRHSIAPIGCVVADRDLYRAEQDTVHLFIAFPNPVRDLRLLVKYQGDFFTERTLKLKDGVGIETFSMLQPGNYSAQLLITRCLGTPISFTVAEYNLAPLSARLISHQLNRETEELSFKLAVESYQMPFEGKLMVKLVEQGVEVADTTLEALLPGQYSGCFEMMRGKGPFRLRLMAIADSERVAEVAIPGSRVAERQFTVISELGQERLFSMMPEANALPIRGGYLSKGDFLASPLTVAEIVTEQRLIQAHVDVESVVLVNLDLISGDYSVQQVGDVTAGNSITNLNPSPLCMTYVGCFINGQPFEGFTTFIKPTQLQLSIDTPDTIRPQEDLVVHIKCDGVENKTIPVLLCVRDERLTAQDKPEISLGAAVKRNLDTATQNMDERTFTPLLTEWLERLNLNWRGMNAREKPSNLSLTEWLERLKIFKRTRGEFPNPDVRRVRFDSEEPVGDYLDIPAFLRRPADDGIEYKKVPLARRLDVRKDIVAGSSLNDDDLALEAEPFEEENTVTKGIGADDDLSFRKITPRTEFPEMLFCELVPVCGSQEVHIPLGDSLGTFSVEAFAMTAGDWTQTQSTIVIDKPVRIDLELPLFIHPDDKVIGHLRAITPSSKAHLIVTHNGNPVKLSNGNVGEVFSTTTPIELEFEVKPGIYRASVEDSSSGETDSIEVIVKEPGKFKFYAKELGFLLKKESLNQEAINAISLRVLPSIDTSFDLLMTATADYEHLCCEQTAAKILAATVMYLTAKNQEQRRTAESIILAGITREQKMLQPKHGFAMYPNSKRVSEYYSKLAVRYLWYLNQFDEIEDISLQLRQAVSQGLSLADIAAKAHKMQRVPTRINGIEDAYTIAAMGKETKAIRQFIAKRIDFSGSEIGLTKPTDRVTERATLAYTAASLIAIGDLELGIKLANQVTRQLNEQGRLYSTVDSVAAIALMIQLRLSGLITGTARLRVNNQEMTALEANQLTDNIESLEVLDGVAAVEIIRIHEENWESFAYHFPVKIGFRDSNGKTVKHFQAGERTELIVSLPNGYQMGDLIHVVLPPALSWIQGGGKVKLFTRDFEGKDEIKIPLIVTSKIEGKQHFAVCVRNMFEEERVTNPGMLTIEGQ